MQLLENVAKVATKRCQSLLLVRKHKLVWSIYCDIIVHMGVGSIQQMEVLEQSVPFPYNVLTVLPLLLVKQLLFFQYFVFCESMSNNIGLKHKDAHYFLNSYCFVAKKNCCFHINVQVYFFIYKFTNKSYVIVQFILFCHIKMPWVFFRCRKTVLI